MGGFERCDPGLGLLLGLQQEPPEGGRLARVQVDGGDFRPLILLDN